MNNRDISPELRAQLTELIIKEGGKNPEITVKFLMMAVTDVLRLAHPPKTEDTADQAIDELYPRDKPVMSRKGFSILLEHILNSAEQASGYNRLTFIQSALEKSPSSPGLGVASNSIEDLADRLVSKGIDPIWVVRSLINSATKMALIRKTDPKIVIHILLMGISSVSAPSVQFDATALVERMAADMGISKADALTQFKAMMETFGA